MRIETVNKWEEQYRVERVKRPESFPGSHLPNTMNEPYHEKYHLERQLKVEKLKKRVQSGDYKINSDELAHKLAASLSL